MREKRGPQGITAEARVLQRQEVRTGGDKLSLISLARPRTRPGPGRGGGTPAPAPKPQSPRTREGGLPPGGPSSPDASVRELSDVDRRTAPGSLHTGASSSDTAPTFSLRTTHSQSVRSPGKQALAAAPNTDEKGDN